MAHTHTYLKYHVVFSTVSRRPLISDALMPKLHEYMGGVIRELNGVAHIINGTSDPVHLLIGLSSDIPVAKAVQIAKANSTRWMRQEIHVADFAWQVGYAAFTVSASSQVRVQSYIENQAAHHKKFSFEEELRGVVAQTQDSV